MTGESAVAGMPERTGVRRSMTPTAAGDPSPRRSAGPPRAGWADWSGRMHRPPASRIVVAGRRRRRRSPALHAGRAVAHAGSRPVPRQRRRQGPGPAPGTRIRWRSRCPHLPPVAVRAECTRHLAWQRQLRVRPASTVAGPPAAHRGPLGAAVALCSPHEADGRLARSANRRSSVAPEPGNPRERHIPAWPSTPPRNSSSSLSTLPGCSATSSARKPARWGRTAVAT